MILIFSDSHNNYTHMQSALLKNQNAISCVIHCGDHFSDALYIRRFMPDGVPLLAVCGNCDYAPDAPGEIVSEIGGKRFLITHGHKFGVKTSFERIKAHAASQAADICVFGHTHNAAVFCDGGILFINPGSVSVSRNIIAPTYGVINISGDTADAVIVAKQTFGFAPVDI